MPRLFIDHPLHPDVRFELPESNARHVQVLRMQPGETITLFNGGDSEYSAEILEMGKRHVAVRILDQHVINRESPLHITLLQSLSATERMDYTIQKATELGVARIRIIQSALCSYKLAEDRLEKRMAHWRAIAVAAAEQCGRTRIPEILPPIKFMDYLTSPDLADVRILLSPLNGGQLSGLPTVASSAVALIGPEGGFSDEEEAAAVAAGFSPLLLGPRIFRTETMAPVIAALLQARFGDL